MSSGSVTKFGREEAAVELHALDDVDLGLEALAFFDRDDAVLADLLEGVGHDLADLAVVVGADGGDVLDVVLARRSACDCFLRSRRRPPRRPCGCRGPAPSASAPAVDVLEALAEDRLGQHGRGRGAVAGVVAGLAGGLLHELGAHVLGLVRELDLLGDGDAVLGDGRAAPALVEDGVAPARAQGALTARASFSTPASRDWRASASKASIFAAMCSFSFERFNGLALRFRTCPAKANLQPTPA